MNPAAHQRIEELLNRGELPLGKISLDLAEALRRGDITTGSGVLDNGNVTPGELNRPLPVIFCLAGGRIWTFHGAN